MKPKAIKCIRPDKTAIICPNCPDAGSAEKWATDMGYEIAFSPCLKCIHRTEGIQDKNYKIDAGMQWREAKCRALKESKKSFDPVGYMKNWELLNPKQ